MEKKCLGLEIKNNIFCKIQIFFRIKIIPKIFKYPMSYYYHYYTFIISSDILVFFFFIIIFLLSCRIYFVQVFHVLPLHTPTAKITQPSALGGVHCEYTRYNIRYIIYTYYVSRYAPRLVAA